MIIMAIIKEPKGVDFIVKSEPWSDQELHEFSKLIKEKKSNLDPKVKNEIKKFSRKVAQTSAQLHTIP